MSARVIQEVNAALREFTRQREEKVLRVLLAGIPRVRLSYVTRRDCEVCHGAGTIFRDEGKTETGYRFSLAECPQCPGLVVTP